MTRDAHARNDKVADRETGIIERINTGYWTGFIKADRNGKLLRLGMGASPFRAEVLPSGGQRGKGLDAFLLGKRVEFTRGEDAHGHVAAIDVCLREK